MNPVVAVPHESSSVKPRLARWLFIGFAVLLAITVVGWWVLGLRSWTPTIAGFSRREVSVEVRDTRIAEIFALVSPGVPVQFLPQTYGDRLFSVILPETEERDVYLFIGRVLRADVIQDDGRITVTCAPWLERSHHAVAVWLRENVGVRLWPNR